MTKLKPVFIGMAAAFSALVAVPFAITNAPPSSKTSVTPKNPEKSFFGEFNMESKREDWKYVFAGDGGHGSAAAFQFTAEADILDKFHQDGGRSIFLELSTMMQPKIDALYDGKISVEEFIKTGQEYTADDGTTKTWRFTFSSDEVTQQKMEAIAQTIVKASELGIRIYAADERVATPDIKAAMLITEEYERVRQAFAQEFIEKNKDRIARAQQNGTLSQIEAEGSEELQAKYPELTKQQQIADALITKSQTDDHKLASFIKSRAGDGRAMVVYGLEHLQATKPDSLYSLLGKDGVARFSIYQDVNDAITQTTLSCQDDNGRNYNRPKMVFTRDDKTFKNITYTDFGCPKGP